MLDRFCTEPESPSFVARRCTAGRKPTPWTMPVISKTRSITQSPFRSLLAPPQLGACRKMRVGLKGDDSPQPPAIWDINRSLRRNRPPKKEADIFRQSRLPISIAVTGNNVRPLAYAVSQLGQAGPLRLLSILICNNTARVSNNMDRERG